MTECARLIAQNDVFGPDHGFLRRIAYVESKDGEESGTYRSGYDGGIWQVDKIGFDDTQNSSSHATLHSKWDKIQAHLSIDWSTATWTDCRKPLYSALAALCPPWQSGR